MGELLLWLSVRYRLKRDDNFQDYRPDYLYKDVYKQFVPYQEYFTSLGPVELKGRQEAIEIYTWQQDISGTSG